ncbi:MAG: serine/threonine protein kinase [Polyangiaceae bacterium]|nr:serine/threonine protein kinase [Polyangiaceae bacterium]
MPTDPEVFGQFLLVQPLAQSAMAQVFLAVRLGDTSGRLLVLKRPPLGERPSGRAAQALFREAEVLSQVRGAGIVTLEAAGEIAGLPYVAVERLRGQTLAGLLERNAPLPSESVRIIGKDIARALAKLHAAGWVHRDVTASNIFVDDAGECTLIDFGLCARVGDERGGDIVGTRGYAAPEAATAGAAHPPRDVYGLAVCLAEAALGRRLFQEAGLVEAAGREIPPRVHNLGREIDGLVRALDRDPNARPTAAQWAEMFATGASREVLAERVTLFTSGADPSSVPTHSAPRNTLEAEPVMTALAPMAAPAQAPVLTPTAAMPSVSGDGAEKIPTLREAPIVHIPRQTPLNVDTSRPPPTLRTRSSAPAIVIALVFVVAALGVGFFVGRFSQRGRGPSFSIDGNVSKRTDVYLDGRKLTFADGVAMPVSPGSHALTLVTQKGARREIPFAVKPGEHLVLVLPERAPNAPADDP